MASDWVVHEIGVFAYGVPDGTWRLALAVLDSSGVPQDWIDPAPPTSEWRELSRFRTPMPESRIMENIGNGCVALLGWWRDNQLCPPEPLVPPIGAPELVHAIEVEFERPFGGWLPMKLRLNGREWAWDLSNAYGDTILLAPYWLEQILVGHEPRLLFDREDIKTDMQLFPVDSDSVRWVGIEREYSEGRLLFDVIINRKQMVEAFYRPLREMWQSDLDAVEMWWDQECCWHDGEPDDVAQPYQVRREMLDRLIDGEG